MLSFISWGQFWTYIAIALVFYYLFIAVVYYGNEIQSILKGRSNLPAGPKPLATSTLTASVLSTSSAPLQSSDSLRGFDALPSRENEPQPPEQEAPIDQSPDQPSTQADEAAFYEDMEDIADRLKAMMERTGIHTSRAELMDKIIKELRAFSSVVDIALFKQNLFEYIQVQSSELCDVELEDTDLDAIWNNLQP
jgi:hypothetical protein